MDQRQLLSPVVIVAALGYFVDIYDLLLFNVVRIQSLRDLGLVGRELEMGAWLHNLQMSGMLVGGIAWGVLGDRRGRLSVLFGSIALYSVANLANAFVTEVVGYGLCRFVAGVGLAGELGAGVTLVAEALPARLRGWGTTLVATVGVSGAILAGVAAQYFDWRTCYVIGGLLGLALLALRVGVVESHLFDGVRAQTQVRRGDVLSLLLQRERFLRLLSCVLIGAPIWFVIGVLVAFAPEFGAALGLKQSIETPQAVMACYAGLVLGDLTSGALSQWLQTRRRVVIGFVLLTAFLIALYLMGFGARIGMYWMCGWLGFAVGYWAILVTVAAEQFGTNLRATVATSVPNFVRFLVVPMSLMFLALKPAYGMILAASIVGGVAVMIALVAGWTLRETYGRSLDFIE